MTDDLIELIAGRPFPRVEETPLLNVEEQIEAVGHRQELERSWQQWLSRSSIPTKKL